MRKQLAALEAFHRAMGVFLAERPTADVPEDVRELRIRLLQEELEEYIQAARAGSLVDIADALTDLLYVLLGTFVTHGLQDVAE
ncbi:MAG: nucleoside triphosphate pyrophosphohydrolase family protein, partial [Chloroflexi bacterium]|nr:nucleoside triphosphate pyrophosphohydrolase family protein [Chloroflexota bacterium]